MKKIIVLIGNIILPMFFLQAQAQVIKSKSTIKAYSQVAAQQTSAAANASSATTNVNSAAATTASTNGFAASLLYTKTKKVGKTTTLSITKRTPDYKTKPTVSNVLNADNEEVSPTNPRVVCKTEVRKFTAENMNQDIVDPSAMSLIKLGGVFSLENMQSGNYNCINASRSPIKILLRDASQNAILVDNPDATSLQQALDRVRNIPFSAAPSGLGSFLSTTQVTSRESLDIAAGLSFSGFGFDASNKFNYNSNSSTNKFLLSYTSANYIAEAQPLSAGALFSTPDAYSTFTPVYVSQITYGTKLLVFFEENISEEEIKNKFEASYGPVKGNLDIEVKNRLANTNFKIYLYGSSEGLFTVTGYEDMLTKVNELLTRVAIGNKTNPIQMGQPISYQLKFMDGDIAVTSAKVEDIPQKICGPNPEMPLDLEVNMDGLQLDGGVFFGWLDAQVVDASGNDKGIKGFWIKNREDDYYQSTPANPSSPMISQTYSLIDKSTRDNGYLRIWYRVQNRDIGGTDVRLSYLNTVDVDYALNPIRGGWKGNYIDVPLKEILAVRPGEKMQIKRTIQNGSKAVTMSFSAKFKF
jgi:Thiol-activated cytolysin